MEQRDVERLLQAGRERGADFVELFQEETRHTSLSYANSRVDAATSVTRYGVGIRLLFGTDVLYAHASRDDEPHLLRLIDAVCVVREPTSGSGERFRRQQ